MGIVTLGQREKTGEFTIPLDQTKWRVDTVNKVLTNPTYAGDIVTGNQRTLLVSFLQDRDDLTDEYIEYVDDGYTGTNFERPGFKRMIEDAKTGKIDTILVKDFSRFGRDYIGVGDYLEQVLPILGIRFISLNNNYDSNDYLGRTMGMDMAIHNLVNNLYSKDISKKLKSALRVKWKNGQGAGGKPPFGYLMDKETDVWMIDPVAHKYVKMVFDKAIEGCHN